jgi:hypothetical protein
MSKQEEMYEIEEKWTLWSRDHQLLRGISVSTLINESCGGDCRHKYPYCFATSLSTLIVFSTKTVCLLKLYQEVLSTQCSSTNCVVGKRGMNIQYWAVMCHYNSIAFSIKMMLAKILSNWIFISVFIKGSYSRVWKHAYPYCDATLHATSISYSVKIMHQLKSYEREYLSRCSSRNGMVGSVRTYIHTTL